MNAPPSPSPPPSDLETAVSDDDRLDLRVWLRLFACASLMESRVRRHLRTDFDTTLPRFDLLSQLYRAPEALTMGELSRRLMVSNGNVTGLIDRLVGEGLVARRPWPGDRRVQQVSLTEAGVRAFEAMIPAHRAWVGEMTREMDRAQLDQLYRLLGALKQSVSRLEEEGDTSPAATQGGPS